MLALSNSREDIPLALAETLRGLPKDSSQKANLTRLKLRVLELPCEVDLPDYPAHVQSVWVSLVLILLVFIVVCCFSRGRRP